MTDAPLYYVPRTAELKLSTGVVRVVTKGVKPLSDEVAGDPAADRFGIKPVHEMTVDERKAEGLPPAEPDVKPAAEPAKADPAPAPAAVAPKPATASSASA
jgi:hypothetical protein